MQLRNSAGMNIDFRKNSLVLEKVILDRATAKQQQQFLQ
jgi:hypothetical protein